MAANEMVCVSPREKRAMAHVDTVGLAMMRNVLQKDSIMANQRTADNSRPDALMTGVSRCLQNTTATARVSRMPACRPDDRGLECE